MAAHGRLRLVEPAPRRPPGDSAAVAAVCLLTGAIPWLGLALLGRWNPAELATAGLLLGLGFLDVGHLLSAARHRSHRT